MGLSADCWIASPASTYSTVILGSFLGTRLIGSVETGFRRHLAEHDDGGGQSTALVVAAGRAVPVVTGAVEEQFRPALRVVEQPEELPVAVAREQRRVRVLVVVDDRQFDDTAVRHDQNRGIPGEFVLLDPN